MKQIDVPGIGVIKVVKSLQAKSIRLTLTQSGDIRVTMPKWLPYASAVSFAKSHGDWIARKKQNLPKSVTFNDGQRVGKLHSIYYETVGVSATVSSRVTATKVIIKRRSNEPINSDAVQGRTLKAVHRALKKEAEQLIPPRVKKYADEHGFSFRSISAKQLKRRWGSCDSHKNLVFNFFLMDLPWECIDYVIMHELTHTEHMNHGPDFWARLKQVFPRALDVRKIMRDKYRPALGN